MRCAPKCAPTWRSRPSSRVFTGAPRAFLGLRHSRESVPDANASIRPRGGRTTLLPSVIPLALLLLRMSLSHNRVPAVAGHASGGAHGLQEFLDFGLEMAALA